MVYRMGMKTSVYLSDELAAAVKDDSRSLAELIRHALAVKPVLIEPVEGHIRHWYCEVPPMDAKFKVPPGADHWRTDTELPIREIYEAEVMA